MVIQRRKRSRRCVSSDRALRNDLFLLCDGYASRRILPWNSRPCGASRPGRGRPGGVRHGPDRGWTVGWTGTGGPRPAAPGHAAAPLPHSCEIGSARAAAAALGRLRGGVGATWRGTRRDGPRLTTRPRAAPPPSPPPGPEESMTPGIPTELRPPPPYVSAAVLGGAGLRPAAFRSRAGCAAGLSRAARRPSGGLSRRLGGGRRPPDVPSQRPLAEFPGDVTRRG